MRKLNDLTASSEPPDQQPIGAMFGIRSRYLSKSIMLLFLDSSLLSQAFPIAELHNRPLPTPSPFPASAIAAPILCLTELLV